MNSKILKWHTKNFQELTATEVYDIAQLRNEVFIVEQKCIYLDLDDIDRVSHHVFLQEIDPINNTSQIVAYTRAIPKNIKYTIPSLGRVVVKENRRHIGISQELLLQGIKCIEDKFGDKDIVIHAQAHLEKYYNQAGFLCISDKFMEDDIPHIKMLKSEDKDLKFDKI